MARLREDQVLVPSVLDRLIDYEPGVEREPPQLANQVLRELKSSVQRDLQNLLNTRWRCEPPPADLDELRHSLVNYGIPDFTGLNLASDHERDEFRWVVEQAIRNFEPRFKSVRVELLENADSADRTLRLRIDALLYAAPAPEPVVFDSVIKTATGTVEIRGAGR